MPRYLSEEPGFQVFVDRLERFPVLDREEELELARRWRDAGDRAAADALVNSHLRSVVKIAYKYRGYGIYLSDLVAEGSIGLLEAVKRFEPERGLRFLTYARYWVRAYMLAHILKHYSIVDLGTTALQSKMFFRLQAEHAKLTMELGEGDDRIERRLAEKFDTSVENVRESLQRLARRDTSLDVPIVPDSSLSFLDMLTNDDSADQAEEVAAAERANLVHDTIADVWPLLDCRERLILSDRLFVSEGDGRTLAAIGRQLGVTRERVRQLESVVKRKLRDAFTSLSEAPVDRDEEVPAAPQGLVQLQRASVRETCEHCPAPQLCAA